MWPSSASLGGLPPYLSHLLTCCGPLFPSPLLYQRPLWSSRLSVFSLFPPKVPSALHRGGRFYIEKGWKGFIFRLNGFILCACVCVRGSFYFRGEKWIKKKNSQGRRCYADRPLSAILHLHSSAEWKRFLSPLLRLMYKWVHLVFIRGPRDEQVGWGIARLPLKNPTSAMIITHL